MARNEINAARPPRTDELEKLPLGSALGILTAGHVYSILSAFVLFAIGCFLFGSFWSPVIVPLLTKSRMCASQKGYPYGYWSVRGVKIAKGPDNASIIDGIFFNKENKTLWFAGEGKQLISGKYEKPATAEFTIKPIPAPGDDVTITFTDKTDRYFKSVNSLHVTDDGCWMFGDFQGTRSGDDFIDGIIGYCWAGETMECPPLPADQGWRPPVISPHKKLWSCIKHEEKHWECRFQPDETGTYDLSISSKAVKQDLRYEADATVDFLIESDAFPQPIDCSIPRGTFSGSSKDMAASCDETLQEGSVYTLRATMKLANSDPAELIINEPQIRSPRSSR